MSTPEDMPEEQVEEKITDLKVTPKTEVRPDDLELRDEADDVSGRATRKVAAHMGRDAAHWLDGRSE